MDLGRRELMVFAASAQGTDDGRRTGYAIIGLGTDGFGVTSPARR